MDKFDINHYHTYTHLKASIKCLVCRVNISGFITSIISYINTIILITEQLK